MPPNEEADGVTLPRLEWRRVDDHMHQALIPGLGRRVSIHEDAGEWSMEFIDFRVFPVERLTGASSVAAARLAAEAIVRERLAPALRALEGGSL